MIFAQLGIGAGFGFLISYFINSKSLKQQRIITLLFFIIVVALTLFLKISFWVAVFATVALFYELNNKRLRYEKGELKNERKEDKDILHD